MRFAISKPKFGLCKIECICVCSVCPLSCLLYFVCRWPTHPPWTISMAQAALCDITPHTRIPTLLIVFCVHMLLLVGRCKFRPNTSVEHLSRGGGELQHCNIFPQGGGGTTSLEYLSTGGGGHHLSEVSIQRGGRTPPQWNIFPQGGGAPPQWNISPEGGGVHDLSGISIQMGGRTPPHRNIFP